MATARKTVAAKPTPAAKNPTPPADKIVEEPTSRPRAVLVDTDADATRNAVFNADKPAEVKADAEMVTGVVPKGFTLTLDDHTVAVYNAGTQKMPRAHAEHWFSKAHGVTIFEG